MSLANLVNTSTAGPLSRGLWKRRRDSDGEDGDQENKTKMPRYSYYVTLESESPQPTDEDEESIYSIQGKETDYVKDTSDTSTHTWVSSCDSRDVSLRVEYEVASLSEEEDPFPAATSTSDPDDIMTVGVIAAFCDSDLGLADNSNDSRSSVDSEIGKADYWTCVRCNASNNNPLFRYCEKCYQNCWQCRGRKGYRCFSLCERCFKIRKNFFPPRPKWRRRRFRRESASKSKPAAAKPQELICVDSGLGSSQESKFSLDLDLNLDQIVVPDQDTPTSSSKESLDSGFPGDRASQCSAERQPGSREILDQESKETLRSNVDFCLGSNRDGKFSVKFDEIVVPGRGACELALKLDEIVAADRGASKLTVDEFFREDAVCGQDLKSILARKAQQLTSVDCHPCASQENGVSVKLDETAKSDQAAKPGRETPNFASQKYLCSAVRDIPSPKNRSDKVSVCNEEPRNAAFKRKRSRVELTESGVESSSVSSKGSDLSSFIEDSEGDDDRGEAKRRKMAVEAPQEEVSEAWRTAVKSRAQSDAEKLCIVCTTAPMDGAFVHKGKIHCCCCYPCALKVWRKTKNCPICRRKVKNVHKIFYH